MLLLYAKVTRLLEGKRNDKKIQEYLSVKNASERK